MFTCSAMSFKSDIPQPPLLDLTVTNNGVISGDFQHSQSSASLHNVESGAVSYFNPGKPKTE
jgi:hypothetical protein